MYVMCLCTQEKSRLWSANTRHAQGVTPGDDRQGCRIGRASWRGCDDVNFLLNSLVYPALALMRIASPYQREIPIAVMMAFARHGFSGWAIDRTTMLKKTGRLNVTRCVQF